MTTFLLDSSVLIALVAREHVHHDRAHRWMSGIRRFALCPIVEGSLVRFAVRLGASGTEALQVLRTVSHRPGFEFWPDSLSLADTRLDHVLGHRQVTDAYLASLAASRPEARLATIDKGLAQAHPDVALLVPVA